MYSEHLLREFIRDNYEPDEIWDDIHDDCPETHSTQECLDVAADEGWINPDDPQTYEAWHVERAAENLGLTLGADLRSIGAYHDEHNHTGAVQWCTHPVCNPDY